MDPRRPSSNEIRIAAPSPSPISLPDRSDTRIVLRAMAPSLVGKREDTDRRESRSSFVGDSISGRPTLVCEECGASARVAMACGRSTAGSSRMSDALPGSAGAWVVRVRLVAVPFALLEVAIEHGNYPPGYERWAWATTAVLAGAAILSIFAGGRLLPLVVDTLVVSAYVCRIRSSRARLCASSCSCLWPRRPSCSARGRACCGPL